jgi:serine/threonine-protein kinase HipA
LKTLNVFLHRGPDDAQTVGQLAEKGSCLFFEYDPDFLHKPLWLSPFKLPPEPGLHEHTDHAFGPIFGLFDDSLPDGWGLLLMDRFFRKKGIDPARISVLDRLAFLGNDTMGALTYQPAAPIIKDDVPFDLQGLAEESRQVLTGKTNTVLPRLMRAGGSPAGARPKVLVGVNGDILISGETDLPAGFEHWIVKFAALNDFKDSGPLEYAYSLMAREAGVRMPETRLFETIDGQSFFGVKRFDRKKNHRFHVHTFGNLIQANFRIPCSDYENFFKIINVLTRNRQDLLAGFRMMLFNILAHNRDDHVKNFSFIMNDDGEWNLAPGYDLTYAPGPGGEHSMTVLGEGRHPGREEVMQLGVRAGLTKKDITLVLDEIRASVSRWNFHAAQADLSYRTRSFIASAIKENLDRM